MGKGDKKSKRGKISIGSFGVRRSKKSRNAFKPAPEVSGPEKVEKGAVPINKTLETPHLETIPELIPGEDQAKKGAKKSTKKATDEGAEVKAKATKAKKKGDEGEEATSTNPE